MSFVPRKAFKMSLRQKIEDNFSTILRCLEPSNDLLGRLRATPFVKDRISIIKQQTTIDDKSYALLDALLEVPDDLQESVMNDFIAALRSSGQDHVANIFHQESDKVPMSDDHYELLSKKMNEVCQFLEPRDGIIDELLSCEIFTISNCSSILYSKLRVNDMARQTIEILQRKSDDSFEKFISALNETRQDHVVYILTGVGVLPMSQEHRDLLYSKKKQLEMFCDPINGVLSELVESRAISGSSQEQRIRSITDPSEMALELVETLMRSPDDAFDAFINALNKTGQSHVIYILTGEDDSQPVSEEWRAKLKEKRSAVVSSIYAQCLVSTLVSKGVFSEYDQRRVESRVTNSAKGEMIVDLIARKSQSAFDGFICTLMERHHEHVAEELMGPEVVGEIQTRVGTVEEMAREDLVHVVREIMQRAFNNNETEAKKIEEVLSSNGLSVTEINSGSIVVKFRCRDHAAFASLENLYTSKRLDQLFTEAFSSRFAKKGLEALILKITDEEFERHKELQMMTTEHREALLSSEELLVEKLSVKRELLDKLSLCPRRRQTIERAATPQQQVKTLLDIVSRQPDSAFRQLLNALRATEQQDVATIISGDSSEHAKKCPAGVCRKRNAEDTGNNHLVALNINS